MEEIELTEQPLYDKKYIISLNQFIFLNTITIGLYSIWWTYKSWRIFQERDPSEDLMPIWRTLFGLFFYYSLFERIKNFAWSNDYQKDYSSGYLLLGIVFFALLSFLPYPYSFISLFDIILLALPFRALNHAIANSSEYEVVVQDGFNTRQTILIVLGSVLWSCQIYVLFFYFSEHNNH